MKYIKRFSHEVYVFLFFVTVRLYFLGYEMFNTDVWKWKQRIYDFGTGVFTFDFVKTIQMYHPGVPLMWLGSLAIKFFNLFYRVTTGSNPPDNNIEVLFQLHFLQKLFIVLALGLLVTLSFYLLKKLFSTRFALIAIIFLSLEPFYYALTRVIHLEGLQTTFMFLAFLSMYYFLENNTNKKWLYISSFMAACAVLTKTAAVFLVPYVGLLTFLYFFIENRNLKTSLNNSLVIFMKWFLAFSISFVLIWPAMWVAPLQAFRELGNGVFDIGVEGGHIQLFRGEWVEDPGYLFYLYAFAYRSSVYLFIGLIGLILVFKGLSAKQKKFIGFSLIFVLFYLIEISIPSKKLDRYVLPVIVILIPVVAFFYEKVILFIESYKPTFRATLILFTILLLLNIWVLNKDYFSYYNPIFGGVAKGMWVIEPKWVIGQHELIKYLQQKMQEENTVPFTDGQSLKNVEDLENRMVVAFPEKYYTQLHPFVRRIGSWATIVSIKPDAKNSLYIIFPVWFDETDENDPWEFYEQVYLRGVPVYNVYKNTKRFEW